MKLLAHISDLHFGRTEPRIVAGLIQDLVAERPHFIIVTGDLTQSATRGEFAAARAFLNQLPAPYLVIPGNHDIPPIDLFERFTNPYGRYRKWIQKDLCPIHREDDFAVIGINTARRFRWRWNWALGSISFAQIQHVKKTCEELPAAMFKILATHHPFMRPVDTPDEDLAGHAEAAIEVFEEVGVDLILSGHLHRAYSGELVGHSHAAHRSILVAQASTATSTRLRKEPNAYNCILLDGNRVGFRVRAWELDRFAPLETAWFEKANGAWKAILSETSNSL